MKALELSHEEQEMNACKMSEIKAEDKSVEHREMIVTEMFNI